MSIAAPPNEDVGRSRPATVARAFAAGGSLLPGLGVVAVVTAGATALGSLVPVVGGPVIAIVAGIALSLVRRPGPALRPGMAFASRQVLQGSIIVLGLGLSAHEVLGAGVRSLPVLVGTLVAALVVARVAGRRLRLSADLTTLVGVGTAICGASAIAATDAVIAADVADVSYAIATIFSFNVVAVLLYPSLGHLLGLSQHAFGLWAGTAINDMSSVVAASTVYGHAATSYAVVVKLTRTLAILPIALGLAALRRRTATNAAPGLATPPATGAAGVTGAAGRTGTEPARFSLRRVFPLFVLGFVAAVAANSIGMVPHAWHPGLGELATLMITAALASIGLSTDVTRLRRTGPRPLALGAILWATVGLTSLALQVATGTL